MSEKLSAVIEWSWVGGIFRIFKKRIPGVVEQMVGMKIIKSKKEKGMSNGQFKLKNLWREEGSICEVHSEESPWASEEQKEK